MNVSRSFYRVAAACSIIAALLAILAEAGQQLSAGAEPRYENILYILSEVFKFCTVLLALVTFLGVALLKRRTHGGLVSAGFMFFFLWGVLEVLFRSFRLFVLIPRWRPALAAANDEATAATLRSHIDVFSDVTFACFVVIVFAALVGAALFGAATWRGKGWEKAASVFFFLYSLLAVAYLAGIFIAHWMFPTLSVVYIFLRVPDRLVWGIWLWRAAKSG